MDIKYRWPPLVHSWCVWRGTQFQIGQQRKSSHIKQPFTTVEREACGLTHGISGEKKRGLWWQGAGLQGPWRCWSYLLLPLAAWDLTKGQGTGSRGTLLPFLCWANGWSRGPWVSSLRCGDLYAGALSLYLNTYFWIQTSLFLGVKLYIAPEKSILAILVFC